MCNGSLQIPHMNNGGGSRGASMVAGGAIAKLDGNLPGTGSDSLEEDEEASSGGGGVHWDEPEGG